MKNISEEGEEFSLSFVILLTQFIAPSILLQTTSKWFKNIELWGMVSTENRVKFLARCPSPGVPEKCWQLQQAERCWRALCKHGDEQQIRGVGTAVSRHRAAVGMVLNVKYYSRILSFLQNKLALRLEPLIRNWPEINDFHSFSLFLSSCLLFLFFEHWSVYLQFVGKFSNF